ncbi:MAG: sterol desaturase family protein [Spirochaetales bacterium]|nr:sterol desaturase family protein [Leptospiraceae bacterium]MCP5483499.1 sterol desaturase family protein [Spirochaetales bacterium]MCP5486749.1 sterol desaturase family protein [Spirochaetales bacterium]
MEALLPPFCQFSAECMARVFVYQMIMNTVRYYPIAALVFFVLWVWKKTFFSPYRIQERAVEPKRIWYEIRYSFYTLVIFVVQATLVTALAKMGYSRAYLEFGKYGPGYELFAFVLLIVWHETFFYWMHRLIHHPRLFKWIHLVHHRSTSPSPFAAYSFHPIEGFLEALYVSVFIFVVPVHPVVVVSQAFYAMIMNIAWHSGYEFFPSGWTRGRFTRWINTSTHHNMHHSHVNCNYSLYLNFWDRICGTNHPRYDEYFEAVRARARRPATGAPGAELPAA